MKQNIKLHFTEDFTICNNCINIPSESVTKARNIHKIASQTDPREHYVNFCVADSLNI